MYNSQINKWKKNKDVSLNPYHPMARKRIMEYFEKWLKAHPQTDVVRLTTLAYSYTFDIDSKERFKYWDWFGYTDGVSILALEDFEKQYGYRLRPEYIVDQGYYNATYKIPTHQYRDWMVFIHKFVLDFGKEIVDRIHKSGKKAAIFWGDQWAGVETYSDDYQDMKIDINVGACEDGVALRRLADLEGEHTKEIRLYPYFFPDVFKPEGKGKPKEESVRNWAKIRRALLRKGVDRIGHGGYLSLAAQYPDFIDHVEMLCNEFRTIKSRTQNSTSYTAPIRVGILNYWGKIRSWVNDLGPDEKFYFPERLDVVEIAGSNPLECLSGLPVQVNFINFKDIIEKDIFKNLDVVINYGSADTSWSGGRNWSNPRILTAVRDFVHNGGGFIGINEPSAYEYQGAYFQLYDVLGVQKETGKTTLMKYWDLNNREKHFITEDMQKVISLNSENTYVYPYGPSTEVLLAKSRHVQLASNVFGLGRSVYISNIPYNSVNTRILLRALFWVSRKENEMHKWFSSNLHTECAAYPETGYFIVINNSGELQTTIVYDEKSQQVNVSLEAFESKWFEIQSLKLVDCYS
jgi:1,3-beta-galactosyl-N-acetylhexosamine phosphorylase